MVACNAQKAHPGMTGMTGMTLSFDMRMGQNLLNITGYTRYFGIEQYSDPYYISWSLRSKENSMHISSRKTDLQQPGEQNYNILQPVYRTHLPAFYWHLPRKSEECRAIFPNANHSGSDGGCGVAVLPFPYPVQSWAGRTLYIHGLLLTTTYLFADPKISAYGPTECGDL